MNCSSDQRPGPPRDVMSGARGASGPSPGTTPPVSSEPWHSVQIVAIYQLAEHWYFGKRRGDDDGFGLVWQGKSTQLAFTDEGINWRRRVSLMN